MFVHIATLSRFVRIRIFKAERATCGSVWLASRSEAHIQFGFLFIAFSQISLHLAEELTDELVSIGPEISSLGSKANAFSRNFEARAVSPEASQHKDSALNASARNGFALLFTLAALATKVKIDRSSRERKISSWLSDVAKDALRDAQRAVTSAGTSSSSPCAFSHDLITCSHASIFPDAHANSNAHLGLLGAAS